MAPQEAIFRNYTQAQGEHYATARPGYSPELFQIIIDHHTSTGGRLGTVLDVGCGTGQATRMLAPYFADSIGLDPSANMLGSARSAAPGIRFEMSVAEVLGGDLDPPVADGSVDLVTVATAAHWFDMARFWRAAARVLRPGGTVAIWARTGMSIDVVRTPNGAAVRSLVDAVMAELQTYAQHGNKIARDLYVDLPLPWTLEVPVAGFDRESFFRKEWNKEKEGVDVENLGTGGTFTTEQFKTFLTTTSSVARWNEAHPDKVGTDEDILNSMKTRIDNFLHEAGVNSGEETISGGVTLVVLMVKKI